MYLVRFLFHLCTLGNIGERMGSPQKRKHKKSLIADLVDPYELYELSVQNVAEECSFVDYLFKELRGRKAHGLREDFCGTASAACEWVRSS